MTMAPVLDHPVAEEIGGGWMLASLLDALTEAEELISQVLEEDEGGIDDRALDLLRITCSLPGGAEIARLRIAREPHTLNFHITLLTEEDR